MEEFYANVYDPIFRYDMLVLDYRSESLLKIFKYIVQAIFFQPDNSGNV